jgi:hypothetical protein
LLEAMVSVAQGSRLLKKKDLSIAWIASQGVS